MRAATWKRTFLVITASYLASFLVILSAVENVSVSSTSTVATSAWRVMTDGKSEQQWHKDGDNMATACALDAFHANVKMKIPVSITKASNPITYLIDIIDDNDQTIAQQAIDVHITNHQDADAELDDDFNGLHCEFDQDFCVPRIIGINLPDIKTDAETLNVNHTIILQFQDDTNRPDASSKESIDQFILFPEYVGDQLVGQWIDAKTLRIRVVELDAARVKPLRALMQELVQTQVILPHLDEHEGKMKDVMVDASAEARIRIEPTGTYRLRVIAKRWKDHIVLSTSPSFVIRSCEQDTLVITSQTQRSLQDLSPKSLIPPTYWLNGMTTHAGDQALILPDSSIAPVDAGSWSISFWLFLMQDSTGDFRTLFFHGNGTGQHRTPSAWFKPNERKLVLRVSTHANMDVGMDSAHEVPVNKWVHLAFTFRNCSLGIDTNASIVQSPACQPSSGQRPWHYSISFFMNGVLDREVLVYSPVLPNDGPLHVGKGPWTSGLRGFTSQFRVFSTPLTIDDHRAWYRQDKPSHQHFHNCLQSHSSPTTCLSDASLSNELAFMAQYIVYQGSSKAPVRAFQELGQQLYVNATQAFFASCQSKVAWDLLLEAAELEHPNALRDVGIAHLYGQLPLASECKAHRDAIPVNASAAVEYLEKALLRGQLDALKPLCVVLALNHSEVEGDPVFLHRRTVSLQHLAAVGGSVESFAILGRLYRDAGDDELAAYHYYHAAIGASKSYHEHGNQPLHEMNRLYDGLKDDVTKGQLGDDDELIQFQKMRADKENDVEAMAAMGDLYYWGARGVERDHAQAIQYFRRAAEAGHTSAQSALAGMLLKGEGAAQDNVSAIAWYEKAAIKNHTRALNGLGFVHFHGSGGQVENKTLALTFFERAAANEEDGDSIFNAGYCHVNGLGTTANVSRAMAYYTTAARKFGHFDAVYELGKLWYTGHQSIDRDVNEALVYLKAASDAGRWANSMRQGFDWFLHKEYERAVVQYHEAAQYGYPMAVSNLAYLYDQVLLQPNDATSQERAFSFLMATSELNHDKEVLVRLGDYHYYGYAGLAPNPTTALRWYSRASAEGVDAGAYAVGYMYEYGVGVPINTERSRRYYERVLGLANGSIETQLVARLAMFRLWIKEWLQKTPWMASWITPKPHANSASLGVEIEQSLSLWQNLLWSSSICVGVVAGALGFRYIVQSIRH